MTCGKVNCASSSGASVVNCTFSWTTSVVLFVHVYKSGGTTIRQLFRDWAAYCGQGGAFIQAGSCRNHWADQLPANNSQYICLGSYQAPLYLEEQGAIIRSRSVVAGHISFGFGRFIPEMSPVYITCLRHSLSRFVSALVYEHRHAWKNL